MTVLSEHYTVVGYDLPFERDKPESWKKFIAQKRKEIETTLRTMSCVPIQKNLWILRDETFLPAIKELLVQWTKDFEDSGFKNVQMDSWFMGTDMVGATYIVKSEIRFVFDMRRKLEEKEEKVAGRLTPEERDEFHAQRQVLDELFEDALREVSRHPEWFPDKEVK